MRWLLVVAGLGALAGCSAHPPERLAAEATAPRLERAATPGVEIDRATGRAFVEIDVLTYNVKALPWPLRWGGDAAMADIAAELARLRAAGRAPQVVLLQEAFSPAAGRIGRGAGYAYAVRGPRATDDGDPLDPAEGGPLVDRRASKAENWGKLVCAGLYAFADMPIRRKAGLAFGDAACAGYDCLANKGALLFEVEIPGVPVPVAFLTTHLNARKASGVGPERSGLAHGVQMARLGRFLDSRVDPRLPLIFGGDFNMKRNPERLAGAAPAVADLVPMAEACAARGRDCADTLTPAILDEAAVSRPPTSGWLAAQLVSGARHGQDGLRVDPVRAEPLFHRPVDGRMLSDHVGQLVRWRISWPVIPDRPGAPQVADTSVKAPR